MSPLLQKIIDRIRAEGPITFETYMGMALYEPGLGYYASPSIDIGQAADYYTSTNVNALFGALVARQVHEMWEQMGQPSSFVFLEQGGGRGLFAKDFLDETKTHWPEFYATLEYRMVEISEVLRDRQKTMLSAFEQKVRWFDRLEIVPPFDGVIFSNELVDAFPVHVVEFARDGLREVYVTERNGQLTEELGPCSTPDLPAYFESLGIRMKGGYRTEVNLNAKRWLMQVAAILERGYVITVDYGFNEADYFQPDRTTGTLICYHQHTTNDKPLERPGEQDITSHANFSDLVRSGRDAGLEPEGFVTQSSFLLNMGIDRRLTELHASLPEEEYLKVAAQVRTLLMPGAMGETHKVLIQRKGGSPSPLRALSIRNRIETLG